MGVGRFKMHRPIKARQSTASVRQEPVMAGEMRMRTHVYNRCSLWGTAHLERIPFRFSHMRVILLLQLPEQLLLLSLAAPSNRKSFQTCKSVTLRSKLVDLQEIGSASWYLVLHEQTVNLP